MVQRQAKQVDAYERVAAQQGHVAARSHWDTNVGELRVERPLDRVDYHAVRLPILVVDEEHRLVFGRPWLVFGIERKSGMPHGYFLSWEPPSYGASVMGSTATVVNYSNPGAWIVITNRAAGRRRRRIGLHHTERESVLPAKHLWSGLAGDIADVRARFNDQASHLVATLLDRCVGVTHIGWIFWPWDIRGVVKRDLRMTRCDRPRRLRETSRDRVDNVWPCCTMLSISSSTACLLSSGTPPIRIDRSARVVPAEPPADLARAPSCSPSR